MGVVANPQTIRATLQQLQRALLTGDEEKGTKGGEKARFKPKEYLINGLIAKRCLTGIAAFNKVGKTKLATELVASLIYQQPFMGNPVWQPAPPLKAVTIHPGGSINPAPTQRLSMARGLMEPDKTLIRRSLLSTQRRTTWPGMTRAWTA